VDITTQATPVARLPWRQIGVLALIGVLLAAIAVAYVGSRQQQLAPPFGLAANGAVAFARDGDIYAADQATGTVTPIVTGPETDTDPAYTPDGSRLAFLRAVDGAIGQKMLMVANVDGTGLTPVTPEPLVDLLQWTFSPDGRAVLTLSSVHGRRAIRLLTVDGSSAPRTFDDVALSNDIGQIEAMSFRPPDGSEILVMTTPSVGLGRAIEAIDVATGQSRTIVDASTTDIFGAGWSPTGADVTYQRYGPSYGVRAYIVGADGQNVRLIDPASTAAFDFADGWSNDGTRILLRSRASDDVPDGFAIVPVDGSGPRVDVRCGAGEGPCPEMAWSPDDSTLLGVVATDDVVVKYVMVDSTTGRMTDVAWAGDGRPNWQRRAP
jgi:Tol biopolymer transport system component